MKMTEMMNGNEKERENIMCGERDEKQGIPSKALASKSRITMGG